MNLTPLPTFFFQSSFFSQGTMRVPTGSSKKFYMVALVLLCIVFITLRYKDHFIEPTTPTIPPRQELPGNKTESWIEVISWEPRIFVYHNILTPEECAEIIRTGSAHLTDSQVVGAKGSCKFLSQF
mgnify:CR=1 FL=1